MSHPNPIALNLFGIDIRWYGILISLGFVMAISIAYIRAKSFSINGDSILTLAIFTLPISIIFARLYYVFFNFSIYKNNIYEIFNIRGGGLAIHGGLLAGILVSFIFCKKTKISFLNLTDLIAPSVALAQSIGRWGNFFNGEAHGSPTDLPWAIEVDGINVHPTFLYESIWCFFLFLLLLSLSSKRKFRGQISLLYGMLYSLERFFVEALRTDSLMIGPLKQAQVISVIIFIICLALYFYLKMKNEKQIENKISISDEEKK